MRSRILSPTRVLVAGSSERAATHMNLAGRQVEVRREPLPEGGVWQLLDGVDGLEHLHQIITASNAQTACIQNLRKRAASTVQALQRTQQIGAMRLEEEQTEKLEREAKRLRRSHTSAGRAVGGVVAK